MASVLSVDAQGVQLVLGVDTAELSAEIIAERNRATAAERALGERIANLPTTGGGGGGRNPDAIVELDVQGLEITTTTDGGENETEQVTLPDTLAGARISGGQIIFDKRLSSGTHTDETLTLPASNEAVTSQASLMNISVAATTDDDTEVQMALDTLSGDHATQGITLATNALTFANAGDYRIHTSLHIEITGSASLDRTLTTFWIEVNGVEKDYTRESVYVRGPSRAGFTGGEMDKHISEELVLEAGDVVTFHFKFNFESTTGLTGEVTSSPLYIISGSLTNIVPPARSEDAIKDLAGGIAGTAPILAYDSSADTLSVPDASVTETMLAEAVKTKLNRTGGGGGGSITYLAGNADFNAQTAEGIYAQTTNSQLTNAPFSGPLVLLVNVEGNDLTQQAWSRDRPGLYAERQALGGTTLPSTITSAWRPHHSRAQLPQTLNDVTEVVMEALEDEPASYRPTPIEFNMAADSSPARTTSPPPTHTASARSARTAERSTPVMSVRTSAASRRSATACWCLVADSAFGGRLIKIGGTLNFRWTPQLGINRDQQVVALETLVDGQDYLLLQGTAVLSGDQGASLRQAIDGYIEFTDSVDDSTRFAPGSYQPESIRQSRFNMPMRNGAPAYLSQGQVDQRVQALRPNPFTTAEKAKLAGIAAGATVGGTGLTQAQVDARVNLLTRRLAKAATTDANVKLDLEALLQPLLMPIVEGGNQDDGAELAAKATLIAGILNGRNLLNFTSALTGQPEEGVAVRQVAQVTITAQNQNHASVAMSLAANLGDTGDLAMVSYEGTGDPTEIWSQVFRLVEGGNCTFLMPNAAAYFAGYIRSRTTENDIYLGKVSTGSIPLGDYTVYAITSRSL